MLAAPQVSRARLYEHVYQQLAIYPQSTAAATSWFDAIGTRTASGAGISTARPFIVLNAADHPGVSVLNLQVSLTTTAAQTGVTLTFGLYPVGISGTTTTIPTLGTVVAGSTVAFSAPGSASESRGNSGDFAFPATDLYMIGCAHTGSNIAGSSHTVAQAILRMR